MIEMTNLNDSSIPPTDRPSESLQLLDADNQTVMETRGNRAYPWLIISAILSILVLLLYALIFIGAVILTLQSRQESGNSLKIDQNTQPNSRDKNELQTKFDNSLKIDQNTQLDSSDKTLFYMVYEKKNLRDRRICLFDSYTNSVEPIAKFHNYYEPYGVATTQNKIFAIRKRSNMESFEIFDLNTRQISRGPDSPEWREYASVAYFKDKLYYLGGKDPEREKATNRVDVLIDGKWQTGPTFPLPTGEARSITCDGILYVIDGYGSRKIYRLSADEREWIEIEEIPEKRYSFEVASLNGRIYITGGKNGYDILKSCLCFDPSAPVDSRISRIADMNYIRYHHSIIVANEKLYIIGGLQYYSHVSYYNSIEEYDPQTNKWRVVGEINSHKIRFYYVYSNNGEYEGRICLFNSSTSSVEEIAKFHNWYWPYEVATTQNKIFGINSANKSFEIYDLNTRQISRGPDPPEWRLGTSVAYFKDKLYYLSGEDPKTHQGMNRVDVLIDGQWQTGPVFPLPISGAQTITCDGILYVIDGFFDNMIYRLSDDEREWIEIGKIPERRYSFEVASLNGKIYITGGFDWDGVLKSSLCFDPSAPVDNRISRIADMNYAREDHSIIVASGKLYAIGGYHNSYDNFCNSIEEYNPQTDEWREVGKLT